MHRNNKQRRQRRTQHRRAAFIVASLTPTRNAHDEVLELHLQINGRQNKSCGPCLICSLFVYGSISHDETLCRSMNCSWFQSPLTILWIVHLSFGFYVDCESSVDQVCRCGQYWAEAIFEIIGDVSATKRGAGYAVNHRNTISVSWIRKMASFVVIMPSNMRPVLLLSEKRRKKSRMSTETAHNTIPHGAWGSSATFYRKKQECH